MIFQATFHPQCRQKGHHGRQRRALEADPQLVVDGPRLQAMAKLQDTLEQLVAGENTCEGPQKIHRNWENGEFTNKWKDFMGFRADFVRIVNQS